MKNLTLIYISALTIIALVILFSQYLVQQSIQTSRYDSRTINIAGRQSMLSQKIAKSALAAQSANAKEAFVQHIEELKEAAQLWEVSHNALQYGSESLELNNVNNSDKTLLLFLELEPHYIDIKNAVTELLEVKYDSNLYENTKPWVEKIAANESKYLSMMDEITLDYDRESSDRISNLSQIEYILVAIALFLLLLEALFIFRPAINRINLYTQQLEEKEISLQNALEEQQKEKEKVDYLNQQAQSVFDNVPQGLFLLNQEFLISDLYSNASEEIFEQTDLAGKNFVQMLRNRLVQRDQEALEMFVKHLFNPDIEEDVLRQLNPVDQVQIFPNNIAETDIDPRHIRINFSRIQSGEKIRNVLVNVTDETQTVRMQQKISEAEERNQRESTQLLSILKVDPLTLRDFLETAKNDLKNISTKYETDRSGNFRELVSFTFNTIHNLKGNASIIDLQLLVDKFHEMEETLVSLKNRPQLEGGDFLKVLYEINDSVLVIMNMQRMLIRISEVKMQMTDEINNTDANAKLVETLQKGLQKLSEEIKKPARLQFIDNGIQIPERFRLAIKDISIQLFRNSLIHGIESPEERESTAKSSVAEITIEITKKEGQFHFSYKDDGRGLDMEKITRKAVNDGLITEDKASMLSAKDKSMIIFNENFSTSDTIDQYAGRGQGMNLVKGIVDQFEGKFEINSTGGKFFAMNFSFPEKSGFGVPATA